MRHIYAIHLAAPHDTNENPRSCYLLYGESGAYVGAVDEGYAGERAIGASGLCGEGDTVRILARVPTSASFVRRCLAENGGRK